MRSLQIAFWAASLALCVSLPATAQEANRETARLREPVLRVTGTAEVTAEPDIATFTVGAEVHDPSASKAMAQAGQITDALLSSLKALGIPQKSIQTVALTLFDTMEPTYPDRVQDEKNPPHRVYVATHIFQVEVGRDRFDRLGDYLDAAMKTGANSVGNISFGIKDDTSLREKGLAQAVANARAKADIMAKAANLMILGVWTLEESGNVRTFPMDVESKTFAMRASAPTPEPPSEIKRTYSVNVEYALNRPSTLP